MSLPHRKAPWDRTTKYWCKYCSIFVFDNRSSRTQHESGAKHRDNVQKYLRQIGKDAKAKSDAEAKLSAQLAKIEEAAAQSYRNDVGGGDAAAAAPPAPASTTHAAPGAPPVAAAKHGSSGTDAVPSSKRPTDIGIAGAWEVVEEPDEPPSPPPPQDGDGLATSSSAQGSGAPNTAGLRGAELLDDEDHHAPQLADFEIKEKTLEAVPSAPGAGCDGAAEATFKKRRAPANRSTRKQRKL
ncbi:hypothetical protein H4R19_002472 [Coemansia spiralis]|nr:hypothetical protein H4R19_002472 [Coemansia spiralis]